MCITEPNRTSTGKGSYLEPVDNLPLFGIDVLLKEVVLTANSQVTGYTGNLTAAIGLCTCVSG